MIFHSGEPGKKTFMYFSSEVGKGFIISDDEEVTGVISVKNPSRKKTKKQHQSIKDRITGTKSYTLKRTAKRKRSKKNDIPNFLFVNKPHFSSEESIDEVSIVVSTPKSVNKRGSCGKSEPKTSKKYRSEVMLRIPSR